MKKLAPREKLIQAGAESLDDAELLAIFLRTGTHGISVMTLARQMLNEFGSLYCIMTASERELSLIKGVGRAKLTQLHAIAELGRRFFASQLARENVMENPQVTRHYLQSVLAHETREIFMVLFLDNQHRVLQAQKMFAGSIDLPHIFMAEAVGMKLITGNAHADDKIGADRVTHRFQHLNAKAHPLFKTAAPLIGTLINAR